MDTLYPNLYERFKSEGLCPVCLMEMELAPRYTCTNGHTICCRCKPYYYGCPRCHSSLEMEMPASNVGPSYSPPPTHFLPHPLPQNVHVHEPCAPPMDEFLHHERNWLPPTATECQQLRPCLYAHLGCCVNVPEYLADIHESRCQFRPHLEEEQLPTDLAHRHDDLVECKHRVAGCKVRAPTWRISIHEDHCNYKERFEELTDINEVLDGVTITDDEYDDPEELVECKYRKYGCMVHMPRRRKLMHQQKCNYGKYDEGDCHSTSSEGDYDPDEQVPCRWSEYGCRVKPKRSRAETHEEKCNYKMEECTYKDSGCDALIHPSRKYAHEKSCSFAD